MRILVVEDQKDLNEIISRRLVSENYSVDACFNGDDAVDYLDAAEYDAVILDIMLPGITGLGVLRQMRAKGDRTPVLLLTALGTTEDKIAGLDTGADDYLVKPFEFGELLARIRAMIRRGGEHSSSVIESGDLVMDTSSMQVTRGGAEISLTSKEYAILHYMMQNPGRVLSRDKILNHIWNYDYEGASNMVDVYIHHLRKKIDADHETKKIVTVKGAGYMLK